MEGREKEGRSNREGGKEERWKDKGLEEVG